METGAPGAPGDRGDGVHVGVGGGGDAGSQLLQGGVDLGVRGLRRPGEGDGGVLAWRPAAGGAAVPDGVDGAQHRCHDGTEDDSGHHAHGHAVLQQSLEKANRPARVKIYAYCLTTCTATLPLPGRDRHGDRDADVVDIADHVVIPAAQSIPGHQEYRVVQSSLRTRGGDSDLVSDTSLSGHVNGQVVGHRAEQCVVGPHCLEDAAWHEL